MKHAQKRHLGTGNHTFFNENTMLPLPYIPYDGKIFRKYISTVNINDAITGIHSLLGDQVSLTICVVPNIDIKWRRFDKVNQTAFLSWHMYFLTNALIQWFPEYCFILLKYKF